MAGVRARSGGADSMSEDAGAPVPLGRSKTAARAAEVRARVEELVQRDLDHERHEYIFRAPAAVVAALLPQSLKAEEGSTDAQDVWMFHAWWSLSIISLVSAVALFALCESHWWGVAYMISKLVLTERFILGLHFSTHRRIFRGSLAPLNHWYPFVIAPTFGLVSGAYELHHVVMHHRANNLYPDDLSATMTFQRDNLLHFAAYWLRYTFLAPFELVQLGLRKEYHAPLARLLLGLSLQVLVAIRLWNVNPMATLWVVCLPHFWCSIALMFGNFSQHIFVDPSDPGNSYQLTYTCIDAPFNCMTFNDGYHVGHHLQSGRHWSSLPRHLTKFYDKYLENDSFVFTGLGFFDVGILVMTGRLEKLAEYAVLPDLPKDELVDLMRRRLVPIPVAPGQTFKIT